MFILITEKKNCICLIKCTMDIIHSNVADGVAGSVSYKEHLFMHFSPMVARPQYTLSIPFHTKVEVYAVVDGHLFLIGPAELRHLRWMMQMADNEVRYNVHHEQLWH